MIPSFATAGVLTAPTAPLVLSGYVPGASLAAQNYNYMWNHITLELNNLLTLGGIVQNAADDTQVGQAVNAVAQKALAIMNCIRVTTGSAMTVPIGSGTIVTALGSGSTYTVTLPSAQSALVAGFEVDIQNHNAGATNMLGSGYGSVLVKLLNVNDGLAGFTNGTWQITEQYGHLRIRPAVSGNPSGFGWIVESCSGSLYRTVLGSDGTQSNPTGGTWYNLGGSLALPLGGVYELSYSAPSNATQSTNVLVSMSTTLSTANNSESDSELSGRAGTISNGTNNPYASSTVSKSKKVYLAGSTTYYLNALIGGSITGSITIYGSAVNGKAIIEARRVA